MFQSPKAQKNCRSRRNGRLYISFAVCDRQQNKNTSRFRQEHLFAWRVSDLPRHSGFHSDRLAGTCTQFRGCPYGMDPDIIYDVTIAEIIFHVKNLRLSSTISHLRRFWNALNNSVGTDWGSLHFTYCCNAVPLADWDNYIGNIGPIAFPGLSPNFYWKIMLVRTWLDIILL